MQLFTNIVWDMTNIAQPTCQIGMSVSMDLSVVGNSRVPVDSCHVVCCGLIGTECGCGEMSWARLQAPGHWAGNEIDSTHQIWMQPLDIIRGKKLKNLRYVHIRFLIKKRLKCLKCWRILNEFIVSLGFWCVKNICDVLKKIFETHHFKQAALSQQQTLAGDFKACLELWTEKGLGVGNVRSASY